MNDAPEGYEELQELALSLRRPLRSLIVLGPENEPFLAARPGRLAGAQWVADLFKRLNFQPGTHVRRIHYVLVSQPVPVLLPSGEPYENTALCAKTLYLGARDARYLGLIPANAIDDHRNPSPSIFFAEEVECPAEIETDCGYDGVSGRDALGGYCGTSLITPSLSITAPTIAQRYHVEIWCEKSTVNDVLLPLGREYGLNIVTGVGEMSATMCEDLVGRADTSDLPVRILYVSDFDPGGMCMPVAVSRKIEFLVKNSEVDIQVRDVVLTAQQCSEFNLPRTPLKDTERRGKKFEERFGEGGTELDALEAIYPGVLRQILVAEIERYHDGDLDENVGRVVSEVEEELALITSNVLARHADVIEALEKYREALNDEGERALAVVRELMEPKEVEYNERSQLVLDTITEELEAEAPDVDDYEWPEAAEGDEEDDPLYDSTRTFLEQIDRYRTIQDKPVETVPWQDRKFPLVCQNPRRSVKISRPVGQPPRHAASNARTR